jgi:hypothetical protein
MFSSIHKVYILSTDKTLGDSLLWFLESWKIPAVFMQTLKAFQPDVSTKQSYIFLTSELIKEFAANCQKRWYHSVPTILIVEDDYDDLTEEAQKLLKIHQFHCLRQPFTEEQLLATLLRLDADDELLMTGS